MSSRLDRPNIFIRIPCSQVWPEPTSALVKNQTAQICFELNAPRGLQVHLDGTMRYFQTEEIFEKTFSHVHTVEFQKKVSSTLYSCYFILIKSVQRWNEQFQVHRHTDKSRNTSSECSKLFKFVLEHSIVNVCGDLNQSAMCAVKSVNGDDCASCSKY